MIPLGALQSGGCSPGLISGWPQNLVVSDRKSGIAEFREPPTQPLTLQVGLEAQALSKALGYMEEE